MSNKLLNQASSSKGKRHGTQQSLNAAVKSICDVMRRSNCAGAMKYVPELTWILFLRILDERESHEAEEAEALGIAFSPSLQAPFRWRDWAAPSSPMRQDKNAKIWDFVHGKLLPHLKDLENQPGANARQKIVSEVMSGVERSRIDSEKNFLDVLDQVHELSNETIDQTHVFTLSQVYEGLLLKMGEKGNDGGQFFTPREIIRVMLQVVQPQIGKTVYDPGCGTGGLFRTNEGGFVQTKRKLLEDCDVYCIVSLPGGVFSSAGAGVKTNLVFFRKGKETEKIWYYDLSDVKVGKKKPLTKTAFEKFFELLRTRGDSERSWTVDFAARLQKAIEEAKPFRERGIEFAAQAKALEADLREKRKAKVRSTDQLEALEAAWKAVEKQARENQAKAQEIEDAVFDLKAVNPNRVSTQDKRTPSELLEFIAAKGGEADAALGRLRELVTQR